MVETIFERVYLFLQPYAFFFLSFEVCFVLVKNLIQLVVLYVFFERSHFPAAKEIICLSFLLLSDCFKDVGESVIDIFDYLVYIFLFFFAVMLLGVYAGVLFEMCDECF